MPIEKRWVVKPQGNPEAVAAMAAALGIAPVLANLLVQRGIDLSLIHISEPTRH